MRKTKIVCTIGPSSGSGYIIRRMIKAGMDVARLNFSHGTHTEHKRLAGIIRSEARRSDSPVALLQDIQGLKIRVGPIKDHSVFIKKDTLLKITSRKIMGDSTQIQIDHPRLTSDLKAGNSIFIDDGLIQLKVIRKEKGSLTARVIEGGVLKEKKGVNFPGVHITAPSLTKKDMEDLELGTALGVDYIALSFVRTEADIKRVKQRLRKNSSDIPVIAKIENRQAIENIENIIKASDGIMIARGDLGVEVPPEEVPMIQKTLIKKCSTALKPVITATQMLESMTEHASPTRAEAADVANAVIDGTDALMLSAETAVGKFPVKTISMMDRIIRHTEAHTPVNDIADVIAKYPAQAIAEAACTAAFDLKAGTIAAFTRSGFTALLVSKFRPSVPVTGFTSSEEIRRRINLYRGITPHLMKFPRNTDEMIRESEKALLNRKIAKKGETIVIIATSPFTSGGNTNIMKLHRIGG